MNEPTETPVSDQPKKSNKNMMIAIVVIVVLCCCCVIAAGAAWQFGDQVLEQLNSL
jgi:hypothetical protein